VAPFRAGIVNLRAGDGAVDAACEHFYAQLEQAGVDVLYDDRDERAGAKFASMDLIGLPYQIIIGPKSLAEGLVEVKSRKDGARVMMTPEAALNMIT
jgi:prolyl-tRNA synthetase